MQVGRQVVRIVEDIPSIGTKEDPCWKIAAGASAVGKLKPTKEAKNGYD